MKGKSGDKNLRRNLGVTKKVSYLFLECSDWKFSVLYISSICSVLVLPHFVAYIRITVQAVNVCSIHVKQPTQDLFKQVTHQPASSSPPPPRITYLDIISQQQIFLNPLFAQSVLRSKGNGSCTTFSGRPSFRRSILE